MRTCPGGVWHMAAGLGVMLDGRKFVVCSSSLILKFGLLMMCVHWLPSAVV